MKSREEKLEAENAALKAHLEQLWKTSVKLVGIITMGACGRLDVSAAHRISAQLVKGGSLWVDTNDQALLN